MNNNVLVYNILGCSNQDRYPLMHPPHSLIAHYN